MNFYITLFTGGNCETCDLILTVNKESVNNVIRTLPQDALIFDQIFQYRGHSGFKFAVNSVVFNPYIRNPDFPCTAEPDVSDVTQTLQVRYHCMPVKPGSYRVNASVYYCGRDYFAQNQFIVMVENGNITQYCFCLN